MTGFSDFTAQAVLNHITGGIQIFARPDVFMALFNGVGSDAGTGFTEVSGPAYARVQCSGSGATNGATASGNNVLHFATTPPWVVPGMYIYNITTPGSIPAGTTVLSVGGITADMSANATAGGVLNGDTIVFSAFNPASGSGPSTISNSATITFPPPTGDWGTVIAQGFYDDPTAGNLLDWDYLGGFPWMPCTVTAASPAVLTAHAHGYVVDDLVVFNTEYGGTAPTFSQSTFNGPLAVVSPTTDTFTVTNATVAVNTSTSGNGMVRKITAQPVPINVVPVFTGGTPGNLVLAAA